MSRIGIIGRKLAVARRQPGFVLLWLFPTWLLIGASALAIAVLPFRRIAALLGANRGAVAYRPPCSAEQAERALSIGRTVQIAARYAPFRSNCLPQALAARALCALWRIPCALHLGLTKGEDGGALRAHAWTACGDVTMTGGSSSFAAYTPVSCFVSSLPPEAASG